MKLKYYLHLAIFLVVSNQSIAQDIFRISPAAFDTIMYAENTSSDHYRLDSKMENLTNSGIEIEWIVEDKDTPSEWQISVADNAIEYFPGISMSPSPFELNGSESGATFIAYISTFGVSGCGTFKLSYRNFLTQEIIQTVNYNIGIDDETCLMTSTAQELIPNFSISPNPTSDVIHLSTIEGIESVEIYDSLGRLVKRVNSLNNSILDISTLQNGLYLIRVRDNLKRISTIEIIKQD